MESIILTGPKYSGKTSTGKVLALIYFCKFIDLDDVVLQKTGKTPRELYMEDPEKFKKAETEALAHVVESTDTKPGRQVIGTGGGIIDNPEAIAILEKLGGTIVYLNVSADSAWDRIANSASGLAPSLRTANPRETHRNQHERRAAAYPKLAKIIIETEGKTPDEIAHEIASRAEKKAPEPHRPVHIDRPEESKPQSFGRSY
jgi:shikimate kinase